MTEPTRDAGVDARTIALAGGALALVVLLAVAGVFGWRQLSSMRPAQPEPVTIAPGAPALQRTPLTERQMYELDKTTRLGGYGWVDRDAGIVHIPIEQAMRELAERLPAKEAAR